MLKVSGFSRVNEMAHGKTRDLRVLWTLEELGRPYELTVADILMAHVLSIGSDLDLLEPFAHVRAYQTRCTERPAWKRTMQAYRERVVAGDSAVQPLAT